MSFLIARLSVHDHACHGFVGPPEILELQCLLNVPKLLITGIDADQHWQNALSHRMQMTTSCHAGT